MPNKTDIGVLVGYIRQLQKDYKDLELLISDEDRNTFNFVHFNESMLNVAMAADAVEELL